jgi:hypothetical protein
VIRASRSGDRRERSRWTTGRNPATELKRPAEATKDLEPEPRETEQVKGGAVSLEQKVDY